MKRRISFRFLEAYILIGLVGFLLITLAGSRMVESVLEEDISSGLYQDAHNIAENQAVKSNLSSSNLSSIQSNLYMLSQYPSVIVWIINNEGRSLSAQGPISRRTTRSGSRISILPTGGAAITRSEIFTVSFRRNI